MRAMTASLLSFESKPPKQPALIFRQFHREEAGRILLIFRLVVLEQHCFAVGSAQYFYLPRHVGHDIAELFRLAVHGLFRLVYDALAIQQGHLELMAQEYQLKTPKQGTLKMSFSE